MLAGTDGNVSYRLDERRILFTPSGRQKAFLKPEDLVIMDLTEGHATGVPSSESAMHLEIYRLCPKAKAVGHAHPPHAVAWTLAHPEMSEIPADRLSEVILGMGSIPIVEYARPGTAAMGEVLRPYLPNSRALVLSRHGAVCWGESLEEVINGMERIEHSAYILWLAQQLGGSTPMPASELEALKKMRQGIGDRLI